MILIILPISQTVWINIFKFCLAHSKWFIMFYAEWCEYCKDFIKTWYKLSNIYAAKGIKFGLVEW